MSFEWSHYLVIARQHVRQALASPYEDALLRSAISRAYYAAFNVARNHVRTKDGVTFSAEEAHRDVANYLSKSVLGKHKVVGNKLYKLRKQRNRADYDSHFLDLARSATKAVNDAQVILDILGTL